MSETTEYQVLSKIKKANRGSVFFIENFLAKNNADAVRKALERLVKSGELQRVATGIYVRPEKDPVLGYVSPSIETIIRAIAKRDKARIIPTGIYALNRLGLTSQVPMNISYLTDGSARKVKIGKRTIVFKRTSPKNLATQGEISTLAIQALRSIGKDKVKEEEREKIIQLLKKENKSHLQHDLRLAPEWIRQLLKQAL
ncbi:hypothetical protein Emtol_3189 [Emticicia oligotrophica DSM 17448]|uniref:Type IV toxin-antitoxin system AbiEi family antitoxin domain-containing protein n=1 Tax=Emticicia oligotrophica (strain DSM 17448 / CIP 109782 / MTCC 6937 / GPTSA100-15) TaxID=929562 RepID=A0ABN4APN2_EMTOG|nr:AbiEi antitoxin N-terminal domain-containing protein [Emticicia oligotrophica]AFK04319.1 hypothetical protein Emtol_3189 [Emticicia oligotrophica DSM 17448]